MGKVLIPYDRFIGEKPCLYKPFKETEQKVPREYLHLLLYPTHYGGTSTSVPAIERERPVFLKGTAKSERHSHTDGFISM